MRALIAAGCLALACAPAWAAYKCVAADGRVSFQDMPCHQGEANAELKIPKPQPLTPDEQRVLKATATGGVTRGMKASQVRSSWGEPSKINRTISSGGAHEQWVYDRGNYRYQYVYLLNGVVSSIQSVGE